MCIFDTKINAKAMHPSIFTMVVARKVWAYKLGFMRCTANIEPITIKVKAVIKKKSTQNFGTSQAPPRNAGIAASTVTNSTNWSKIFCAFNSLPL